MNAHPNQHQLHTQDESPLVPHEGPAGDAPYAPVRVEVVGAVETSTGDDSFGTYLTRQLPGSTAAAVEVDCVLQRDPLRQYAYITALDSAIVIGTAAEQLQSIANLGASPASVSAAGTVTSPTAGQVLATLAVPAPGWYSVSWTLALNGTLGNPEANNAELAVQNILSSALTPAGFSVNASSAGNYGQATATVYVPAGSQLAIAAIGAGTASAAYRAGLTATPLGGTASPQLPSGGYLVQPGQTSPPIRHNEPVYVANTAQLPNRVSVAIERGRQS